MHLLQSRTFQVEDPRNSRVFSIELSRKQTVAELRREVMKELSCSPVTLQQRGKILEDSQSLAELRTDEVSSALLTGVMSPLTTWS